MAFAPPDLAPEDTDHERSQGHFCSSPDDSTSENEADESSQHSDQVITLSTCVSSMHSFSSIPAHPQASLAPSLSTTCSTTESMIVSQESLSDESVSLSSAVNTGLNNVGTSGPSFATVIEGCDDIGLLLHSLPREKIRGLPSNIKYIIFFNNHFRPGRSFKFPSVFADNAYRSCQYKYFEENPSLKQKMGLFVYLVCFLL